MKLLIRNYLASLKEREELDAILPDLLSELGFTVYSRPRRGTTQHGVDIAAVGVDDDGEKKLFLFSVKQGDLTRQDWDGSPQALRPSLNEIRDVYIRTRIPPKYKDLRIVICLAFGGDVHEQVRASVSGYIADNTTDKVSFDEWNGDKIADLLLKGILREEILPKPMRSSFQKAVAMLDEPEVAFAHFSKLTHDLHKAGCASDKARVRSTRQLNICLWILFVWARDVDNLEAPYRASELALLTAWDLRRSAVASKGPSFKALDTSVDEVVKLHIAIALEFLERKILPHVGVRHGISMAVNAQSALDINLAMFEALGRLAMAGLWLRWFAERSDSEEQGALQRGVTRIFRSGVDLISNNPSLLLPTADRQGTDVALFLQLWLVSGENAAAPASWLREMAGRLAFTINTRGRYPSSATDYRDLADHPRDRSDEYFQESTVGSTLIPLLAAWLRALQEKDSLHMLSDLVEKELPHCTLQLWLPDAVTEEQLYVDPRHSGTAVTDLPLDRDGDALAETIKQACRTDTAFNQLSTIQNGVWPILLVACRHHRLPVPPQFWIDSLEPTDPSAAVEESLPA